MKYYCIISTNPVFYISADSPEILQSDYEYLVHDIPEKYLQELGIDKPEEYLVRTFAELRSTLNTIKSNTTLIAWTIDGTELKQKTFGEPVHVYPTEANWRLCTYSPDTSLVSDYYTLNTDSFEKVAKAYIQLKKHEDIHTLLSEYNNPMNFPETFNVTCQKPEPAPGNIIGYVCIPITATEITLSR